VEVSRNSLYVLRKSFSEERLRVAFRAWAEKIVSGKSSLRKDSEADSDGIGVRTAALGKGSNQGSWKDFILRPFRASTRALPLKRLQLTGEGLPNSRGKKSRG